MARKPRIHYPGALYHVILRGNAGDAVFFDDKDRYRFYLYLQYAVERFHCRIHAYCLMHNHVHLLVQVAEISLSAIMQNVSQRYTRWINASRGRAGHLFQGRYKAILVDADTYLLELVRYIHLNPVRAGVCATPEDYPWSGHRCYLGREVIPWLTVRPVLSMLAPEPAQARKSYAAFLQDGLGEGRRAEFHSGTCEGRILGADNFSDEILVKVSQKDGRSYTMADVITAVCHRYQITLDMLASPGKCRLQAQARGVAAALVQITPHLRLTCLAQQLGRDLSATAKAAQRTLDASDKKEIVAALAKQLHGDG